MLFVCISEPAETFTVFAIRSFHCSSGTKSPVSGLAGAENLTIQSQNSPALGCGPVSFFSVFLGSSQPAGRCQPHWVLGKVYFPGPSALLNGLCGAQGVECRANTAKVMGGSLHRGHPAKNICIEGAAKHLE